ncbi:MAG: hypothetical protein AAFV95_01905 [Bacteroidota bacterium]
MKVKILKHPPTHILVEDTQTGKKLKYSKQYFKKQYEMGRIEVENIQDLAPQI